MQTQNPILDEIAKLTTAAMGLAQAAGDEAKAAFRSQTDRLVAEMDLVRREDHRRLKAEIAALRAESRGPARPPKTAHARAAKRRLITLHATRKPFALDKNSLTPLSGIGLGSVLRTIRGRRSVLRPLRKGS
jgi:hypothetical protein